MIRGRYVDTPPPPLPCENLEFFLNLCLVLKQYITFEQYSTSLFLLLSFIYYFRQYNGKHRNCLYTGGRPLPSPWSNKHGRGQTQENVLLGRMGEGSGHQRQCYNCGKSGHLANVCPFKYNVTTKTDKKRKGEREREREVIFIQTANISNSLIIYYIFY